MFDTRCRDLWVHKNQILFKSQKLLDEPVITFICFVWFVRKNLYRNGWNEKIYLLSKFVSNFIYENRFRKIGILNLEYGRLLFSPIRPKADVLAKFSTGIQASQYLHHSLSSITLLYEVCLQTENWRRRKLLENFLTTVKIHRTQVWNFLEDLREYLYVQSVTDAAVGEMLAKWMSPCCQTKSHIYL